MIRKFKTLGIAVVAVFALSAVVASAASAANFTASSYPTTGTVTSGKYNDRLETEAGSVTCHVHLHFIKISAPSPGVTILPTYSQCQAFGFLSATVSTNQCDLTLYVSGETDINCPSGKSMSIVAGTCEMTVAAQTGLSKVDLANSGTGISMQATITGIKYSVLKDGFGCPFSGTGAKAGATYTQNGAVLISSTNGAKIDIG